jgi:hypothetical protein
MGLSMGKKIAGVAVAGAVVLSGAGAVAWADSGSGSSSGPASASTVPAPAGPAPASRHGGARAGGKGANLLKLADHGTLDVKVADKWVTVDFDRGQVTDVAADHVTLARPDGKSVTLKLTPDTRYRGVATWSDLQKDKPAAVVSNADGTARQVVQADKAAKAGAGGAPAAGQPAPTTTLG